MATVKRRKLNDGGRSSSESSFSGYEDQAASTALVKSPEPSSNENGNGNAHKGDVAAQGRTFQELGIIESLCEACTELGFKKPTPIQEESIPIALEGRDLIGLAETGSGKTAAFALPILQALMDKPQPLFGLVLAPTRELAIQTSQQFSALGSLIAVRVATVVGGMAEMDQAIALSKQPHIVVATPGRLLWHLTNTKGFSLRNLKYLVLDEADRLLEMSFGDEIDKILKVLPQRHTYLFSATMGSGVESLQRASLRNPARVSVSSGSSTSATKHKTVATLIQKWLLVPQKRKDLYLIYLISGVFARKSAIIFTRTVNEVARLTYMLKALGINAVVPLHGQMSQSSRLSSLSKFKTKRAEILIATDVAARGLDIPSVDIVMNFDLPGDSTTYIHRVGRTARAGKSGIAISVVTQYDVEVWLRIEKALGKIDVAPLHGPDSNFHSGHQIEEYRDLDDIEVQKLGERVGEAQRIAIRRLKDDASKKGVSSRGEKRKGKRMKDDREEQ